MHIPPIVAQQDWDAAREALLVKEKSVLRANDALAAERRRMPRQAVSTEYSFGGPDGPVSLLDRIQAPSGAAVATTAAVGVSALAAGALTYSLLRRLSP